MRTLIAVLLCVAPAAAGESPLSTPRVSTAVHEQIAPIVASDGDGYYATWRDLRSGIADREFGTALSVSGRPLAPTDTPIFPPSGMISGTVRPSVVWTGVRYVAVSFRDYHNLQAVRIEPTGEVDDSMPVQLLTEEFFGSLHAPLAVSNGRSILISSRNAGSKVALFDEALRPIATIQPAEFAIDSAAIAGASDGDSYLLVNRSRPGVVGALLVSDRGVVLSHLNVPGPDTVIDSTLVWTGDSYIYISTDFFKGASTPPQRYHIQATRFTREGKPVGSVVTLLDGVRANFVRAARGVNGRAVVVWDQDSSDTVTELFAMTTDGVTVSPPHKIADVSSVSAYSEAPYSLAQSSSAIAVAMQTQAGISFFQLTLDGSRAGAVPAIDAEDTFSAVEQRRMAIDRSGPVELAVWQELDGFGIEKLMIGPLNDDGTPAGGEHALWPSTSRQRFAAIARGPSNHLAVWVEGNAPATLLAARVDRNGNTIDATPLSLGTIFLPVSDGPGELSIPADTPPAVIWDGDVFLVAFSGAGGNLQMSRVTATGVRLDVQPANVAAAIAGEQHKPGFARVEGTTFLVWQEGSLQTSCSFLCIPPPAALVRALRFSAGGIAAEITPVVVSDQPYSANPDIASDGVRAAVTWQRNGRVYARRFWSSGASPDPMPIEIGVGRPYVKPTISASGDRFVIAWELVHPLSVLYDVAVASLDANGRTSLISMLPSGNLRAPLAFASASGPMIAYERRSDAPLVADVIRLYVEEVTAQTFHRRAARH